MQNARQEPAKKLHRIFAPDLLGNFARSLLRSSQRVELEPSPSSARLF
jgi:hypothetical protein